MNATKSDYSKILAIGQFRLRSGLQHLLSLTVSSFPVLFNSIDDNGKNCFFYSVYITKIKIRKYGGSRFQMDRSEI